jgi:hypothetical protein
MKTTLNILLSFVLLALTLWFAEQSIGNAWAAGSRQLSESDKQIYANRSDVFSTLATVTAVLFGALLIWNLVVFIKHRRQQKRQ